VPVVIGAFGLATSLEPTHIHPQGWNNGGVTEEEQGELLARFSRNIRDAGMAGGVVFEWLDEWWKQVDDPFVAPFEDDRSSDPMWLNRLDPEETFGVRGFRAFRTVPLLRGEDEDWRHAVVLYDREGAGAGSGGVLEEVQVSADYAHLYLRVDVADARSWTGRSLWIALGTLPGEAGSLTLPGGIPGPESGANFLVQIDDLAEARILVAENYIPWEAREVRGRPDVTRVMRKGALELGVDSASFQELVVEVNAPRWTAEGVEVPAVNGNWSGLPRGSADRESAAFASDAAWNVEQASGMVEVRIPWAKLLVTDPSKNLVFGGIRNSLPVSAESEGVAVTVLAVEASGEGEEATARVVESLPVFAASAEDEGSRVGPEPEIYSWSGWVEVRYRSYLKPSYYALQALWGGWRSSQ
jgi:hypothetical protein